MKVILTTDFTDASLMAMTYAIELLSKFEDKVEYQLMHAFKPMAPYVETGAIPVLENDAWKEESMDRLEEVSDNIKEKYDIAIQNTMVRGGVLEAVKELEDKEEVDLVVMATREKNAFQRLTFGSNTVDVGTHIHTPVLAIPKESKYRVPKKIVFATDLKPLDIDFDSFLFFKDLVKTYGMKLQVLHVFHSEKEKDEKPQLKNTAMHRYLEDLDHEHCPIVSSDTYKGISKFIDENKPDILVVIPRDRSFFGKLFHASITSKMAYHAEIPMLILN